MKLYAGCCEVSDSFSNPTDTSFAALSLLISASESRLDLNSRDVVCSALAIQSSDLTSEFVRLRMNVLQSHAASHLSSGIFDNLDRLPKASLISLASLRGLTPESTVDKLRNQLFTHIGSGGCGSYHMRNPSLLFPETYLAPSEDMTKNVQIELLTQLKHQLTRVPLCRILTMHNVKCSQSDDAATLRRILGAYPKRLNRRKPNKDPKVKRTTGVRREKEKIQSDWPQVVPSSLKDKLYAAVGAAISKDELSTFTCAGLFN
ncbi:hypothetical protein B0H14DRAFT_2637414 [Mycena olivaceomarginata]|nr:hypothetical protein B0H14DRAFT_2637414 [Mycena olivaceomarginata]